MISHLRRLAALLTCCLAAFPQVVEVESGGLKYQTLTKKGITIMFTPTTAHVHNYSMLQVAVSNGSSTYWNIRPENFSFRRDDQVITAAPAGQVIRNLMDKGNQNDVVKLVTAYESALYGIAHMRLTNGYLQRRQAALSEGISTRFKAATAASALALVETRLAPGQSTDGAVFFPTDHRLLVGGKLIVRTAGETFEFNPV